MTELLLGLVVGAGLILLANLALVRFARTGAKQAAAVVALLGPALQRTGTVACTGPEPLRMADFVASLRQQQGHGPALVLRLPLPLTRLSARLGDLLPASVPWCSESLALLDSDNVGDPAEFEQLLGRSGVHYSRLVAQAWR